VKIEKLSGKEFRRKYGSDLGGHHYTTEEGEHVVVLPFKASTKTRMHEIAHAELGHVGPAGTYSETAERELAADKWVYEKLGTLPTWHEILLDLAPLVDDLIEKGYRPNELFTWIKRELESVGWSELDREEKSLLWWWIRDKHADWGEGK